MEDDLEGRLHEVKQIRVEKDKERKSEIIR